MDISGFYTPLPTPLTDDGSSISEIRLARLIQKLREQGATGWAAGTEVGEFNAVGYSDRKTYLEMLMRYAKGTPIIVNVTTPSTVASLDLAQHAERHGATAAVMAPPYWGPFSEEEIFLHYRTVKKFAAVELIVVDPRHFISPETADKIQEIGGIHMATPSPWMFRMKGEGAKARSEEFSLPTCNVTTLSLFKTAKAIETEPEEELQKIFEFTNTYGTAKAAKAAFELWGLDLGPLRSPALPLTGAPYNELKEILKIE